MPWRRSSARAGGSSSSTSPTAGGSGPDHWQTRWERRHGYVRVVQDDWERPTPDAWTARLDESVGRAPGAVVLVAHSLGCILVARWATHPRA